MMKVYVWTSWPEKGTCISKDKPKCIFIGDIPAVPRTLDWVVLRDGFGAERVKSVCYDFVNGDIEIVVSTTDQNNIYGGCLFEESKSAEIKNPVDSES